MTKPKLSSIALLRDSSTEIHSKRTAILRAIILPIFGLLAIEGLTGLYFLSNVDNYSLVIIYSLSLSSIPFYVIFATACHRIIILGDGSLTNRWGLFWSVRELHFVGRLIVLGVISTIVSIPIWFSTMFFPSWIADLDLLSIQIYASVLVSIFIDGRLSLVLPATAIGKKMTLLSSWKVSSGHSWSIYIALLVPFLAIALLDYLMFDLLLDDASLVVEFFQGLLLYPLIVLEVVIITLAYRNLVLESEDEGPPQARRAFYFE